MANNEATISVLKKILIVAGSGLAIIIVLFIAFAYVAMPLFRYLSRPRDVAVAKKNGDALARLRDQSVVAVVAHPDDAEWYAGGTLGMLARNRNRVVVVLATSGEKGGNGIPELAKVREAEQEKAAKTLGYSRVIFLHNPDRGLEDTVRFRDQLANIFEEERPAALLTFDAGEQALGYRHSDHVAAGKTALAVARRFDFIKEAYLFSSSSPDVLFEIAPVVKLKGQALEAHQSQRRGSAWARLFFRFFQFLPHTSGEGLAAGSALRYPELGVKYGEPFRLVRLAPSA